MANRKDSESVGLILNGRFFAQNMTGVQRAGLELLKAFAEMPELKITVALPPEAEMPELKLKNVNFMQFGKFKGNLWEQISLPKFCKKAGSPLLSTGNLSPVLNKNFVILHDVIFKEKRSFSGKKSWVRKMRALTRAFIYKSKAVFTVSDFSADRIMHFYPKLKSRPIVIYSGYEHVFEWPEETVPNIPEEFYFSIGTVNPNKNFAYVLHLAKHNPDKFFLVAGKPIKEFADLAEKNNLENFCFAGYLTDGQLAFLYRRCKGFILPSLYEGFGLPPLEAVALGCRALYLSDIPVFREIYGDTADYFNPYDFENPVELCADSTMTEEQANTLLSKYGWRKAAAKIANVMLGIDKDAR